MQRDCNKSSIVFLLAAVVGISTAAYFIVRARRKDPQQRLDNMLDFCSTKETEIERLLREGAQPTPA